MLRLRRWTAALLAALIALMCATFAAAETPADYNRNLPQVLREGHLYGEAALVIDADTGEALFSKNARVRMYPASTTKIMTLMLALESGISLDTRIVIPRQAYEVPQDSSLVPVWPGDQMSFRDLLYGFMLSSGNDGANAVAVLVAGSLDAFVARMNARAAELGCEGTHFVNAHGYHDPDHYSTAEDIARITRAAMQIELFRQIVATPRYTMLIQRGEELVENNINNANALMRSDSGYYYSACVGVKTGYHSMAGQCFVGAAERDGVRLISVDLHGLQSTDKWVDTIRLFNYGFSCYTAYTLEQMFDLASGQIATLKISNAIHSDPNGGQLGLNIAQISNPEYTRMVQSNSDAAMDRAIEDFVSRSELVITGEMVAPVSEGEIMGRLRYVAQSGEEITAMLIADRDIAEQPAVTSLTDIFPWLRHLENPLVRVLLVVLALLAVLLIISNATRKARTARRRKRIYEARRLEYIRQTRAQQRRSERSLQRRGRAGGTIVKRYSGDDSGRRDVYDGDLFGDD